MNEVFKTARIALLVSILALFGFATFSSIAGALEIEAGEGSCKKPKDSQCLAGSLALGDWTPSVE